MKVLVAGDGHSELHEKPLAQALNELGHEAQVFAWCRYFEATKSSSGSKFFSRLQNRIVAGPLVDRLNNDLLELVRKFSPDAVFLYRGTHIYAATLRTIQKVVPGVVIVGYNNDDPFSPRYSRWPWRHFIRGLPHCDLVCAYRAHNIREIRAAGATRVELLRSWFIPARNYPVELTAEDVRQYGADVVFVGHYEHDGRIEYLEEVVRNGWRLRIFGPGYEWDDVLRRSASLRHLVPVRLVWGSEYNKALCSAAVALCFLSKLNRDSYTRRCFEIPASGTLLLSERTEDLETMFRPGVEADFFASPSELIQKLKRYLGDDELRSTVAKGGLARVHRDGHDVLSRARQIIDWIDAIKAEKTTLQSHKLQHTQDLNRQSTAANRTRL